MHTIIVEQRLRWRWPYAAFTRSTASRIPIALRIAEMLVSSGFPSAESVR